MHRVTPFWKFPRVNIKTTAKVITTGSGNKQHWYKDGYINVNYYSLYLNQSKYVNRPPTKNVYTLNNYKGSVYFQTFHGQNITESTDITRFVKSCFQTDVRCGSHAGDSTKLSVLQPRFQTNSNSPSGRVVSPGSRH